MWQPSLFMSDRGGVVNLGAWINPSDVICPLCRGQILFRFVFKKMGKHEQIVCGHCKKVFLDGKEVSDVS